MHENQNERGTWETGQEWEEQKGAETPRRDGYKGGAADTPGQRKGWAGPWAPTATPGRPSEAGPGSGHFGPPAALSEWFTVGTRHP